MSFSIKTRQETIKKLQTEELDLLIIGGGITGAGVAVQAAASGIKTGLIEMQDFSEGTSSRSTKLVHGGIRYLKNFDVEVVADTVTERAVVQHLAPHIPKPDPMLLPIYEGEGATTFNMFSVKIAMDLYDQLAGVKGTSYENYMLTPEEVIEREPYIKKEGLLGAGVYLDFRNNDARLVIENIKQANEDGAYLASKMEAVDFLYDNQRQIIGVKAKDLLTDDIIEIRSKLVINTSGPWVDKVRSLNRQGSIVPYLRPTKGVHLVVDSKKLPVPQPTYFDTGKQDGRMVFVIPRESKTYFGTTDTDYQGDYRTPKVTDEDVDYLLEVINFRFPEATIGIEDIEASWAGLRPLISGNSGSDYNGGNSGKISDESFARVIEVVADYQMKKASREDVETVLSRLKNSLAEKDSNPSAVSRGSSLEQEEDGLITLSGGKITDYRKMAEGALTLIRQLLLDNYGLSFREIDSKNYQISGGHFDSEKVEETIEEYTNKGMLRGLSRGDARYISDFYGSNAGELFDLIGKVNPFDNLTLTESIRLYYGLEEEMVLTPTDYLLRRTNHMLFGRDTLDELKQPVVDAMSNYFNWTKEQKTSYFEELNEAIAESDLRELKEGRN
ncbi:type 1 glycerol-3-phosphate oxidase [Vagococcus elongatus]|uniref:Alpha-glycerophosphate oxidase n=1 Tax=Vagococcus elongatus TaxID=180344 RepID=A0A430ATY2_9ENTE|nr:type 1 glycerol-3-phosphate oxidase [Vagococcus elongatus]RSU11524.1 alpha-glycerophosphate oxidase [Vagococcus elongatus]